MRKRFRPAERAVFVPGAPVEWLHVNVWRAGVVTDPVTTDQYGDTYLPVTDTGPRTRSIAPGELIHASPGRVRLRVDG